MQLLLVMLGGALGSGARHLTQRAMLALFGPALPFGTLTVNVVGGLLMGLLIGVLARVGGNENWRLFVGVGILGGFTTFSSFSLDVVALFERGALAMALGYVPVPEIDPAVRAEVRALPVAVAYDRLSIEDAAAAARLAPADTTRVARALEVMRSTGRALADWQGFRVGGIGEEIDLAAIVLLPPREALIDAIDARCLAMLDAGALDEVAMLIARPDVPADAPIRRAIGVPALAAHLASTLTHDAAAERLQLETRRYAKRQYTWFRNQPPPNWHHATQSVNAMRVIATLLS